MLQERVLVGNHFLFKSALLSLPSEKNYQNVQSEGDFEGNQ